MASQVERPQPGGQVFNPTSSEAKVKGPLFLDPEAKGRPERHKQSSGLFIPGPLCRNTCV